MEHLTYNKEGLASLDLRRIGNLAYFEGPLLVLYEHIHNKHLYLVDWVDRDIELNRWLVYRVSAYDVLKFINNQISLFNLLSKTPKGHIYAVDIINGQVFNTSNIIGISEIPKAYIPDDDIVFDKADCEQTYSFIKNAVLNCLANRPDNEIDQISDAEFENTLTSDAKYLYITYHSYPSSSHNNHCKQWINSTKAKRITKLQTRLQEFHSRIESEGFIINIYSSTSSKIINDVDRFENRLSNLAK